jgi:amino acid adenylation domain-containing protein
VAEHQFRVSAPVSRVLAAYLVLLSRHSREGAFTVALPGGVDLIADLSGDPAVPDLSAALTTYPRVRHNPGVPLTAGYGEGMWPEDCDLALSVHPDGAEPLLRLRYREDVFDGHTVIRLAGHLRTLLASMAARPFARASEQDLLTADERRALLHAADGGPAPRQAGVVHELIGRQAAATPEAPAVVCGNVRLSFAELDIRANRLAHVLHRRGVGPEALVGIMTGRGPELVVGILGVLRAGAAYLPLDATVPAERLRYLIRDAGVTVMLSTATHAAAAAPATELLLLDDDALFAGMPDNAPGVRVEAENLAYAIYTSGSTGRPKGVAISHGALANYLHWAVTAYTTGAGGAPLFSAVSCDLVVPALFAPLLTGGPVHLVPEDADPGALGAALAAGAPFDFVKLTPGQLDLLAGLLSPESARSLARVLVVGGEALPGRSARHWAGVVGPDGRVINEYGPAEATVGTTVHTVSDADRGQSVPVGRPIPGATGYVLDSYLRLVPAGVTGELYLGGTGLARGYLRRPELTAERFVPNPFGPPGSRLYRTGDLARVQADGEVDYLGRGDDQVKIRGYRVEVGEVEHVLTGLPGVAEAVVVPYEPEPGDRRLAAYLVCGDEPEVSALRRDLGRLLPAYMIPSAFVPMAALPLSSNGKVNRAALPDPRRAAVRPGVAYRAADTELRDTICRLWARALFVDRVGVHDNFFELGGDSLAALRAMLALQAELGREAPVPLLYGAPTPAGLADALDDSAEPVPPLVPLRRGAVS